MADHCCYCPELRLGRLELPPEEAHHAATVLRVRMGDPLILFDGQGRFASALASEVRRRSVSVEVTSAPRSVPRPTPTLVLHVAMPKAARQHVLIEKCTELGVNAIEPVIAEHGVVRPAPGAAEKWRRYAIEAAKQSRQWWLPDFLPARVFADSIAATGEQGLSIIGSLDHDARPIYEVLQSSTLPNQPIHVWIGPEGGFTSEELAQAKSAGIIAASLGASILRVETAAIVVAVLVRLGSEAFAPRTET